MITYLKWLRNTAFDKPTFFIVVGLVFYALATPCPHNIGVFQIAIALSMTIAVIACKPQLILGRNALGNKDVYLAIGNSAQLAAVLFFIIAMVGAASRLDLGLTLWMLGRDILPYFFLILPLLFTNIGHETAKKLTVAIPVVASFVGIVYSLRFIGAVLDQAGSIPLYLGDQIKAYSCNCVQYRVSRDAYCFPFDPAVLFSAIFLVLHAVKKIAFANTRSVLQGMGLTLLSALPITALSLLLNRAMLGLICVALVIFCARTMRRIFAAIAFIVTLTVVMLVASTLISVTPESVTTVTPESAMLADALWAKQKILGSNNKIGELISLYQELSKSSLNLIFGLGWGGQFYSPAVGQTASFTHSIISYALLKAGLLGAGLLGVYLLWVVCTYFKIEKPVRQVFAPALYAINCVFLISLFLQPTYKTPTYGVLLLLVLAIYISTSKRNTK